MLMMFVTRAVSRRYRFNTSANNPQATNTQEKLQLRLLYAYISAASLAVAYLRSKKPSRNGTSQGTAACKQTIPRAGHPQDMGTYLT